MGINQCITLSSLELVARILNWFPDDFFFEKKKLSVQKLNLKKTKTFEMVTKQLGSKECCLLSNSSYGVKNNFKDICNM